MMKYLTLGLFFLFSALHLYASWLDEPQKRKKTKPFLLIFLLLYYLFSTNHSSLYLILALLTSWLGDVLLIPKGHHWFTYGGISFMFSHLFFVLVYESQISFAHVPLIPVMIAIIIYFGISFMIMGAVKETTPKKMVIPMGFYLLCNSTMNIFALMQLITLKNTGAFIAYLGAVFFFISDCSLFLVRYYRKPEIIFRKHFTVMFTYLLGEFLIVLGMLALHG